MLQQTQVATVIPYYRRFLRRFPTLRSLASASEEEVLAAWSGLGYYRRARSLHAAAREVMRRLGGRIPADPALLRSLPGVGAYTAGAVASIAFGLQEPSLDGNVLRVLTRLLALRGNPESSRSRRLLEEAAREILEEGDPGEVNQALMELGALLCTPATPACHGCPLRGFCAASRAGLQSLLPETSPRRAAVDLKAAVAIIRRRGSYLMVRREAQELMNGLWEFPGGFLEGEKEARTELPRMLRRRLGLRVVAGERLASLRQTITYRRVELTAYRATLSEPIPRSGGRPGKIRWVRAADLPRLPHGSATRRLLERLEPGPCGKEGA
jgi:A/G-specific adenine glycosylase